MWNSYILCLLCLSNEVSMRLTGVISVSSFLWLPVWWIHQHQQLFQTHMVIRVNRQKSFKKHLKAFSRKGPPASVPRALRILRLRGRTIHGVYAHPSVHPNYLIGAGTWWLRKPRYVYAQHSFSDIISCSQRVHLLVRFPSSSFFCSFDEFQNWTWRYVDSHVEINPFTLNVFHAFLLN